MRFFLYTMFSLWLLAASCSTPQRMARKCNELFPPKPDSIEVKRDTLRDTFELAPYVHFDTIPCPPGDTATPMPIQIDVPGKKVVIKVPRVDSTIYRRASAIEEILKGELKDCETKAKTLENELAKLQGEANVYKAQIKSSGKWFWWFFVVCVAFVTHGIFSFLGKIKL